MIEINLLPTAEKRRPGRRPGAGTRRLPALPAMSGNPYTVGVGALGVLLFLGLAFAYWRVDTRTAEVRAELEKERADSVRSASTIDLVKRLRARQDTIQLKIGVIRGVDERRYVWPHILDEVSRALPPYTWLTKVGAADVAAAPAAPADTARAKAKEELPGFTVEGNAGSTQALTLFMKSLEASPFIRGVTLVTSEQADANGRSYQKFTLEARYEKPDTSFVETVPVISVD